MLRVFLILSCLNLSLLAEPGEGKGIPKTVSELPDVAVKSKNPSVAVSALGLYLETGGDMGSDVTAKTLMELYKKQDSDNKKKLHMSEFIANLIKTGENYLNNNTLDNLPEYKEKVARYLEFFKSNINKGIELDKDVEEFKLLLYDIALSLNNNK